MKYLIKIILYLTTILLVLFALAFLANQGLLNKPIAAAMKYTIKLYGFKSKVTNLNFQNYSLNIDNITLKNSNINIDLKKIEFTLNNLGIKPGSEFSGLGQIEKINIIDNISNDLLLKSQLKISYQKSLFTTSSALLLEGIGTIINNQEVNNINWIYSLNTNKQQQISAVDIKYAPDSLAEIYYTHAFKTQITDYEIKIKNMPIMLYHIFYKITPNHKGLIFMNDFIKNGHISTGELKATIQDNQNAQGQDKINGKMKIINMELKYDKVFPTIKQIDADIIVNDNQITFYLNEGYSSDLKISECMLNMEWKGLNDTILYLKAKADGPAKNLSDFIDKNILHNLFKAKIDLNKTKGQVSFNLDIEIPLLPGSANKYNILATTSNAQLNIFNDHIKITKANLTGKFTNDHLTIKGLSKINGFNSNIDFLHNLNDVSQFSEKLNIDINILKTHNDKLFFIDLVQGNAKLNIEYFNKNNKGYIKANSDLRNLDLYFDKLGIRKQHNDSAKLNLEGEFHDSTHYDLRLKINGDNKLNIHADIKLNNDITKLDLIKLQYMETNLTGHIIDNTHLIKANLQGAFVDLSNSNLLSFLKKEVSNQATELNIDINKVKLKNNIQLNDVKLKLSCDKIRCFAGEFNSKMNNRTINANLKAIGEIEEWKIHSDNAGDVFKGLDLYNSMKSGCLDIIIQTSRKEIAPGEILPILEGSFTLRNFVLRNTKSVIKLISVISLPGFVNAITGNTKVPFDKMTGKFSLKNDILSIINSAAYGPYFDFTIRGNINIENRYMKLSGHANPALYGITKILGSIPLVGKLFTGTKNSRGLFSAPYKIKESF